MIAFNGKRSMPRNHSTNMRALSTLKQQLTFNTRGRVMAGPEGDPRPIPGAGQSEITLRRVITKDSALTSGDYVANLTIADLLNMYGGVVNLQIKVLRVRIWACNISGSATFDLAANAFQTSEDASVVSYSDVGNGQKFPACRFSIPSNLTKVITLNSSNGAVQIATCHATGVMKVCFEVTADLRI